VSFYDEFGEKIQVETQSIGDSIHLKEGVHSIHIKADSRCVTVKQGPFLGIELDKILVEVK
jgi:hypothetical protein